ncbi:MAG: hypothetical protein IKU86_06535 [Thermoguttaceae bacterium]|nr:hypothetical protein [Thermoguttaceae bacterium]
MVGNETCASANELFRWELDETGGVVITAFLDDKATSVDVPAQIDGKPVVEIGPARFFGFRRRRKFRSRRIGKR